MIFVFIIIYKMDNVRYSNNYFNFNIYDEFIDFVYLIMRVFVKFFLIDVFLEECWLVFIFLIWLQIIYVMYYYVLVDV